MVVTGTSRIPETFEANPTLLRLPLPSQWPTESREVVLPHPVLSHFVKKSCMSSSARILWKSRFFMCYRCLRNDDQCGLWILVNTALYFPHVETIFIGHILITHFLSVDVGYIIVYVLEVAVLYCKHFRNYTLEIPKRKIVDSCVHISFLQFPYIYYVSLPNIMMEPSVCLTAMCYNSCFGPCP